MYRKSKKLLVWALVACMLITNMLFTSAFAATTVSSSTSRFAGADRYATAIAISQDWTTSQYAVLAYGEGFADALAAAPLAEKYNAPILLTGKDALSAGVLDELKRLGVKNVFIVGGEGVVSKAVADALTAAGMTPERLAGADRYATALAVANKLGTTTQVVVANGENYPDALGIAGIAAAKGMPILLTGKDAMSADVKAYIGSKKAYVVGGEGVVSAAVFNGLTGAVRLAGADRYATNLAVLQQFAADLNWLNVFVATGEGFADALAGSALAAKYGSPIVLAGSSLDSATASFLAGKVTSTTGVFAFGGAAVVGDAVVAAVKPAVVPPSAVGVQSVTTLGLNGIRVVFSQEVDKDSAVKVDNYQLDGVNLDDVATAGGHDFAKLASDNKTLTIVLGSTKQVQQFKNKLFTIKDKVVLSKDTLTSIPKYEQVLTFSDTAVPTVTGVSVTGNKKLTVTFSEPVLMTSLSGSSFKIDGNYLSSYGFKATSVTKTDDNYGYKVDLTFDVAIPAGTHTLTTLKGDNSHLKSAAGYFVAATDTSFTIDSVTTAPQVVSVTGETNGTVYVTFDRSMDAKYESATEAGVMFGVNGDVGYGVTASETKVKDNTSDKVIKVKSANVLNEGANVLTIDKDIVDAWGNKLNADNDQRYSFTVAKDTTKPTVVSVVMLSSKRIRIKFSEDVNGDFARTLSNYTLKDSSGVSVSNFNLTTVLPTTGNDDTFELGLNDELTGSNYTLKIKNIIDLASPANVMDDYVATINGIDDVAPEVDAVVLAVASPDTTGSKASVYYSESMDVASATDPANYAYVDTNGKTHSLPSSATVTMGDTGKFVTIEFPSGYTVYKTGVGSGSDYYVDKIRISNVKDLAGNALKDISTVEPIDYAYNSTEGQPTYSENTFKLYKDGTGARAEFELNQVLTNNFTPADFRIAGSDGVTPLNPQTPTSGYVSGKKVVLYFDSNVTAGTKEAVMGFGRNAYLYTVTSPVSANQSYVKMEAIPSTSAILVYDDQIKPALAKVDGTYYVDVVDGTTAAGTLATYGASNTTTSVVLKFTEDIDSSIAGLYKDDFTFTQNGQSLNVLTATVNGPYLVFTFDTRKPVKDTSKQLIVRAKSTVDVRDVEDDGAGDNNVYVPSTDDLNGRNWH